MAAYGGDISDFNVPVFLTRAMFHYYGLNDANDAAEKSFHKERLSVYHDFFLKKLRPSDLPDDDNNEHQISELVTQYQLCHMISAYCANFFTSRTLYLLWS